MRQHSTVNPVVVEAEVLKPELLSLSNPDIVSSLRSTHGVLYLELLLHALRADSQSKETVTLVGFRHTIRKVEWQR